MKFGRYRLSGIRARPSQYIDESVSYNTNVQTIFELGNVNVLIYLIGKESQILIEISDSRGGEY
jgi:hypothetical protein